MSPYPSWATKFGAKTWLGNLTCGLFCISALIQTRLQAPTIICSYSLYSTEKPCFWAHQQTANSEKTHSSNPRHPRGQQHGAIINFIDNSSQGRSSQHSIFPALLSLPVGWGVSHVPTSLPQVAAEKAANWGCSPREVLGQKSTVWVYRPLLSLHSRCVLTFLVPVTALCSHTSSLRRLLCFFHAEFLPCCCNPPQLSL